MKRHFDPLLPCRFPGRLEQFVRAMSEWWDDCPTALERDWMGRLCSWGTGDQVPAASSRWLFAVRSLLLYLGLGPFLFLGLTNSFWLLLISLMRTELRSQCPSEHWWEHNHTGITQNFSVFCHCFPLSLNWEGFVAIWYHGSYFISGVMTWIVTCLENSMDRGAWQAIAHSFAQSLIWLKQLGMHTHTSFLAS